MSKLYHNNINEYYANDLGSIISTFKWYAEVKYLVLLKGMKRRAGIGLSLKLRVNIQLEVKCVLVQNVLKGIYFGFVLRCYSSGANSLLALFITLYCYTAVH